MGGRIQSSGRLCVGQIAVQIFFLVVHDSVEVDGIDGLSIIRACDTCDK